MHKAFSGLWYSENTRHYIYFLLIISRIKISPINLIFEVLKRIYQILQANWYSLAVQLRPEAQVDVITEDQVEREKKTNELLEIFLSYVEICARDCKDLT